MLVTYIEPNSTTVLAFILGLTLGSAFIAASYQNKHQIDGKFFERIFGNFFAHLIVILFGGALVYGIFSVIHILIDWIWG